MSDLKLDPLTGDLLIENGDFVIVGATTGENDLRQSILQDVTTTLRFFFGEWFLDTLAGVPYFEDILLKNANPMIIDGIIKQKILDVKGILGFETFSLNYDSNGRSVVINFDARSSVGIIYFSQEFVAP